MNTPDLEQLLASRRTRGTRTTAKLSPEVMAARSQERSKRSGHASYRAKAALVVLHRDDYESLYRQAIAKIYAERGPLPGDEPA